jgi:CRISPR-associated endonuclease/helicase Cas3
MDYSQFFVKATRRRPFPYQERFRRAAGARTLLRAPTGLGKSDAVLVAWLHRRLTEPLLTPRRLVWCLPGRALTEQVYSVVKSRVAAVGLNQKVRICRLLGGSDDNDITLSPDEPAILVGTQDILLSRALNRGYARRPFRWPIDFALLNNDCYWVLDEVQLLGDGLSTSAQLAAFREKLTCFGPTSSCWISATFDPTWLRTVDFAAFADSLLVIEPNDDDHADPTVQQRVRAQKALTCAPDNCRLPAGAAEFCATNHHAGTLSLVVVNTGREPERPLEAAENQRRKRFRGGNLYFLHS